MKFEFVKLWAIVEFYQVIYNVIKNEIHVYQQTPPRKRLELNLIFWIVVPQLPNPAASRKRDAHQGQRKLTVAAAENFGARL
jgi:hypothetical protein